MDTDIRDQASLEALVEGGELGLQVLHPGGLETTRRLAELCLIGRATRVLDVASGTGESACFLADVLVAEVTGVDASPAMVARAARKAEQRGISVAFHEGDAHALPYADSSFDAVISECALSLLDKPKAIEEMIRVARPGGRVGMHEICWKERTPPEIMRRLAELEREYPETLDGWRLLLESLGLTAVQVVDLPDLVPAWMRETRRELGPTGQLRLAAQVLKRWGFAGVLRIWRSQRVFESGHLGYGMLVGVKS